MGLIIQDTQVIVGLIYQLINYLTWEKIHLFFMDPFTTYLIETMKKKLFIIMTIQLNTILIIKIE